MSIKHSIRNKLITFLSIAIILPIAVSILLSYLYTKESLKRDAIRENSNIVYQGKMSISNYFDLVNNISLSAYSNIQMSNSIYGILIGGNDDFKTEQEIYSALHGIAQSDKDIRQVYLYSGKANRSFLLVNGYLKRVEGSPGVAPGFVPPVKKSDPVIESTHPFGGYGMKDFSSGPPVFTVHRPIYRAPLKEQIGLMSIDFSLDNLRRICDMLYTRGAENIYLLDGKGGVLYSSRQEEIGGTLADKWMRHIQGLSAETGHFEWDQDGFKGITVYGKITMFGQSWILVKQIPDQYLYKNAQQLLMINALVLVTFLIIAIMATVYISFKLTSPIKQLTKSIKQIKLRKLKLDIDSKSTDEVGVLADAIRYMVETIDSLIMQELRLELANKDNQLKALQAQINPHFIYNTLQSIGAVALQNNVPKIYSLTSSLGMMMRYNMNTNESVVPLSKELTHVESYIELQKQRFKQRLSFVMESGKEVLHVKVPKMILQPLVENCFKHGFEHNKEAWEIRLSVQAEDDGVRIAIEDNGIGIPQERLSFLQKQLSRAPASPDTGGSIGLINVVSRIQLFFNQEARIEISNREPSGFAVVIWFPADKEEERTNESVDC
ncbi:cache domain-containing sensor histidine kinase [Paenibacillus caui]|uniref:cache domain-containing sensor histidine kinase n=1 Tax=Paenibacillus caui TaxID=2873927 RepID=UPI001CA8CC22|nr:sensor histidine kinase [Paenibacillus caui]